MTEEWLDNSPPEMRLSLWLEQRLTPGNEAHNIAHFAKELGFAHETMVEMWLAGKSKVPLRLITKIADFFNVDVADILPYYLSQELPDNEQLYRAATRTLSAWEFMLVSVARDVYGHGES